MGGAEPEGIDNDAMTISQTELRCRPAATRATIHATMMKNWWMKKPRRRLNALEDFEILRSSRNPFNGKLAAGLADYEILQSGCNK